MTLSDSSAEIVVGDFSAHPRALMDLAERVEAGEGADREFDARIWAALDGRTVRELDHMILARSCRPPHDECVLGWIDPGKERRNFSEATGHQPPFPHYTSSLDATVALLERVLPGWGHGYATGWYGKDRPGGFVFPPDSGSDLLKATFGKGSSPARALLAAALRALADANQNPNQEPIL